jgi:8-amino-7-oxononanoate synthase
LARLWRPYPAAGTPFSNLKPEARPAPIVVRRRLAEIGLTAQGGLFPVQTLKLPLSLDVKGLHRQLLNFGVKTVLRHGHNGNAQVSFIITARHRPGEIDQAVRALAAATRVQSPGQSTGG